VIYRHERDLRSDLLAKILEHCTIKVFCVVDCNVSRDTVAADDFCQKNFLIVVELTLVRGFASVHIVKYSTTITVKV
jgi:hypothetical protein